MKAEVAKHPNRDQWHVTYYDDNNYIVDITYHLSETSAISAAQRYVQGRT